MLVLSLVGKTPWRRVWQLTAAFLPGKSQRAWQATVLGVTKTWAELKRPNSRAGDGNNAGYLDRENLI